MADKEAETTSDNSKENEENKREMAPPALPEGDTKKTEIQEKETTESSTDKKESFPEIPYKEPSWGGLPKDNYNLELLKNGCIIKTVDLTTKPYYLFGRLPNCDVIMEHPSISRYHAVIQYKASETAKSEQGFYLYDLGSTHGTMINKVSIEPKRYYRLRVGYVIKFGGSSRLYILQGPEELDEAEVQAMEEDAKPKGEGVGQVMTQEELEEWKQKKTAKDGGQDDTSEGISWGMGEDAVEEEPAYPPEFGDDGLEQIHFKDPKKTLRGYFEREGLDLEYEVEETGPGHARIYHCRVKLPIEMSNGEAMYAEAMVTGKKRESVLECATEACRILDANGLLRQSTHESKKQKEKNWEDNDYYDSDEDTFLDRTGSIETKREKRMKKAGKTEDTVETYESLSAKLKAVEDEIQSDKEKLQQAMDALKSAKESEEDLDNYMSSMGSVLDKNARMQIRRKLFDLKKEKQRLKKLVGISKPAALPELSKPTSTISSEKHEEKPTEGNDAKETPLPIKTPSAATEYQSTSTTYTATDSRPTQDVSDKATKKMPSAATETQARTATDSLPTQESKESPKTERSESIESSQDAKPSKNDGFAMPAPPSFKKPRPKATSGSISAVLQGIQGKEDGEGAARKRDRKPAKAEEETDESEKDEGPAPEKKKKKAHVYKAPTEWEAVNDPTYSAWQPPKGQTGDGRTKLNEKFGY